MSYLAVEDERRIYFEHHPGRRRTIVLIHGWGMSCRVWDTVLVGLQGRGYGVASFDQRGCGRSDKDFREASIAQSSEDVLRLVDQIEAKDVVLNGWSLGGAVAVAAAHRLGGRCAGVVLTAGATPRFTSTDDFPYGPLPGTVSEMVTALRADRATFLRDLAWNVCVRPVGDAVKNWMWQIFMQNAPSADNALLELDKLDQRELLSGLECPVYSVFGAQDAVVDPDVCRQAGRIAQLGEVLELTDSGHAPFLEAHAEYMAAILAFVERLD